MNPTLVRELREVVGERGLVTDRARLLPYESDGLALLQRPPELVVLPRDTAETAAVLKLLHAEGVPLVARGAGTGLSGGATPVEGGVLVSTARMRDVLELNAPDRYARVQAGLVNLQLSRACAAHGLPYPPPYPPPAPPPRERGLPPPPLPRLRGDHPRAVPPPGLPP